MPKQLKSKRYKSGDILKNNGKDWYKVNDIRDLDYNGKPIRQYINDNKRLQRDFDTISAHVDNLTTNLSSFIQNVTQTHINGDLEHLIEYLSNLLIINNDNIYDYIILDDDGYIKDIKNINGIILEKYDYPDDILKGYYKLDNNKIVLDENRKHNLYNML